MNRTAHKIIVGALVSLLAAAAATAQTGPVPGVFSKITLPLSQPPQMVPSGAAVVVGNPGPQTYYYWVVSDYVIGNSSPAGPYLVANAPNTLSAANYDLVTWAPAEGAASYDVLRTATPAPPSGACNCAVETAAIGSSAEDQSNTLLSYTVNTLDPSSLAWTLANRTSAAGISKLSFGTAGAERWSVDSSGKQTLSGLNATLGAATAPQTGQTFASAPFFLQRFDASAPSTNPDAQGDGRIAPMLRLETTESGGATMAPLYFFSRDEAGASGGGVYGMIGSVDAQTGSRPNVVANNLVAGADQEYNITGITRSSNVVTATISSSLGAANTFAVGDCVLVNGVADTSFDSGTICETVTAVSDSAMTVTWAQTGTNASSSGGTIAVGSQFFGLELDTFADAWDPQQLTPTIAQNVSPVWGYVSTSNGTYKGTGGFFSDGPWYNGFVCQDAAQACFTAGYPTAGGPQLAMQAAFLARPVGYATSTSGNFSSTASQWQDSFWDGTAEVEHNFSANVAVATGTSPAETWELCFQTNSVCGLNVTSAGTIYGVNGSAAAPAYAFAGDDTTGFFREAGGNIGISVAGTERLSLGSGYGGLTTLEPGAANATLEMPSDSGTLALSGANGSSRGTITITSATSGSHGFATGYTADPICTATPVGTTPPATALSYWVSSTTTTVTVTLGASGTATFDWSCGPAVN